MDPRTEHELREFMVRQRYTDAQINDYIGRENRNRMYQNAPYGFVLFLFIGLPAGLALVGGTFYALKFLDHVFRVLFGQ